MFYLKTHLLTDMKLHIRNNFFFIELTTVLSIIYILILKFLNFKGLYAKFALNDFIYRNDLYFVYYAVIIIEVLAIIFYFFKNKITFLITFFIYLINLVFLINLYLKNGSLDACSCIFLFKNFSYLSNVFIYIIMIIFNFILITSITAKK